MYVLIYLLAIILANFMVHWFGPASTIFNAFFFIGLDLTLRDKLHDKWKGNNLWGKMLALIVSGSVITYILNSDAYAIALASVIAFSAAGLFDTLIYSALFRKKFLVRANGSNVAGAMMDSVLFPTIAFGVFMPWIILGQFAAKTLGGFIWSVIILKLKENKTAPENNPA